MYVNEMPFIIMTLLPIRKEDLSYNKRKKALRYLIFLEEMRDGTIKARGCADGRSQR